MHYSIKSVPALLLLCASCSTPAVQQPLEELRVYALEQSVYENQLPCYQADKPIDGTVERYCDGTAFWIDSVYETKKLDELRSYYKPEGKLIAQSGCKAGALNGVSRTFYPNGNVKSEVTYQDGILTGEGYDYFENGVLRSQTTYQNGLREGLHILYTDSRDVQGLIYFYEDTPVSGVCITSAGQKINLTNAELRNYVKGAGISCK